MVDGSVAMSDMEFVGVAQAVEEPGVRCPDGLGPVRELCLLGGKTCGKGASGAASVLLLDPVSLEAHDSAGKNLRGLGAF